MDQVYISVGISTIVVGFFTFILRDWFKRIEEKHTEPIKTLTDSISKLNHSLEKILDKLNDHEKKIAVLENANTCPVLDTLNHTVIGHTAKIAALEERVER
jgi:hypothetical protein